MLFWLFLSIAVVGFIIYFLVSYFTRFDAGWVGGFSFLPLCVALIMGIIIGCAHIDADACHDEYQERQRILSYQLENNLYDNDNDYGKRELYVEIERWNVELTYNKKMQKDFWLGIFIPDIYDDLKFIELK